MTALPRRKPSDVLREHIQLSGKTVIDVGCGDGALVRLLARAGAAAIGVECAEAPLDRARSAERVGGECYLFGLGQALPLGDAGADVVIFFNSLHHVPVAHQRDALADAARVLRAGGSLYIQEPVADGTSFEVVQPVDDETVVRAHAQRAVGEAGADPRLDQVLEYDYMTTVKYPDFEHFRDSVLLVDAKRAACFAAQETALRERFHRLGEESAEGWIFHQPSRVDLLRRV